MTMLSKIKYKIDKPNISYKTIMVGKRPTDYEIVGTIMPTNIPLARNRFNGIQYNQPDVSENSCSIHWPIGALSDLTGITFTIQQVKDLWEQMKKDGYASEEWWGYGWYAVDLVRKYWNSLFPDNQVVSIAVETGTDTYYKLLDAGYSIIHWYRWVEGYDEDWLYDRILDRQWDTDKELETYGQFMSGWHYLRTAKSNVYNVKWHDIIEIDNYCRTPSRVRDNNNIYGIDKSIIPILCDSSRRIWHEWGYVFMFKDDIDKANLLLDTKLLQRLENRVVYNDKVKKFAIIKDGVAHLLPGKDMSELFKYKWDKTNESYVLGLNDDNWKNIGLSIK